MSISLERTSLHSEVADHEYYRRIGSGGSNDALEIPFTTVGNAFVAFACLGYHHKLYQPLQTRQEITLSVYLDADLQVPILASLAFARLREEEQDAPLALLIKRLSSMRAIIPIVEGWANGGLQYFKEQTEATGPLLTLRLKDLLAEANPGLFSD